jgi:hypothetical protein
MKDGSQYKIEQVIRSVRDAFLEVPCNGCETRLDLRVLQSPPDCPVQSETWFRRSLGTFDPLLVPRVDGALLVAPVSSYAAGAHYCWNVFRDVVWCQGFLVRAPHHILVGAVFETLDWKTACVLTPYRFVGRNNVSDLMVFQDFRDTARSIRQFSINQKHLTLPEIKAFAASRGTRAKWTGSTRSVLRSSRRSGPMQGATFPMNRYAFSEL